MAKKKKADVEEETISSIAEFSEDEELENEYDLDEDAEEMIEDYLEGAPAIIRRESAPVEVNEDYPTGAHVYCRVKASKTHRETASEHNHTLIIRHKD